MPNDPHFSGLVESMAKEWALLTAYGSSDPRFDAVGYAHVQIDVIIIRAPNRCLVSRTILLYLMKQAMDVLSNRCHISDVLWCGELCMMTNWVSTRRLLLRDVGGITSLLVEDGSKLKKVEIFTEDCKPTIDIRHAASIQHAHLLYKVSFSSLIVLRIPSQRAS